MAIDVRVQEFQNAERHFFEGYGVEYQSHYFELESPRLRARVIEVGTGPPVLLVHGGGGFAAAWAPLMAELRGLRLLAVDRPGCGFSDGFDYRGSDLRGHAVSFLAGVLDVLHLDRVPMVANSMGGLWTFWLALDRPERVSAMAQLGCPAIILDTTAPFPMRLLSVPGLNQLMFALEPPSHEQMKRVFKRMGHSDHVLDRLPTELWELGYRAERLPTYKMGWLTLLERVLRLGGVAPGLSLREEELRQVKQQTLFIWGDNDPFGGPDVGRRAAETIPNAKLEVIPGGHLPWLDEPVQCGRVVREFLALT